MFRRVSAAVVCLAYAHLAWGLDASSQKLADRYAAILAGKPSHEAAFDRLWKIYEAAGETNILIEQARQQAAAQPVLAARILEKAGFGDEGRKLVEPLAVKDEAAAILLAGWMEKAGRPVDAAELLEKAGKQIGKADLFLGAAEAWQRAKQPTKALAAWKQAGSLAPEDLELQAKLARAAANAGNAAAASAHWRHIAEKGAATERLAALEELSRLQEGVGNLDEAIAAQESLMALLGPGHWKMEGAQGRLFQLYERANRLGDLEARLQRDAADRPTDSTATRRLAAYYEVRGDNVRKLNWLRKTATLQPNDVTTLRQTSLAELKAGNAAEATALADRILQIAKGDQDAAFLRAELSALSGQEQDAEKRVEELTSAHPEDEGLKARAREFYRRQRLTGPIERELIAEQAKEPAQVEPALALAQFYLDEKRFVEAEKSLALLNLNRIKAEEAAGYARRIASLLHEARLEEGSLRWAIKALQLDPASLEAAMEASQVLISLDRADEVPALLETAGIKSLASPPAEDTDRRFYAALEATRANDPLNPAEMAPATSRMLAALQSHAVSNASAEAWLRLARWREWSGNAIAAEESLRAGLRSHPDSPVLVEGLANHFATAGDAGSAIAELQRLIRLQPDRDTELRRRIGRLEINRGQAEEAVKVFEQISKNQPGDWQAAADLAAAQQAAENWFPAMERWEEAYGLAPVESRRSLRQPILAVAGRLQLHERALDFLERAAAGESDEAARTDLMREAAIFAIQQQIAGSWKERLSRRIAEAGAGGFWKQGLAMILSEEGRSDEAREVTGPIEASASMPSMLAVLKAAEEAGQLGEAARIAGQIVRADKSGDSSSRLRHAELLERTGEIGEAAVIYRAMIISFGRDSATLIAAGDFFDRQGETALAETCYRKAASLGGAPSQILLKLGRMAADRRDRNQAAKDFEMLLSTSRPDLKDERKLLPLPPGLEFREVETSSDPWAGPSETQTQGCRLLAIQELGPMLINSPTRRTWAGAFQHPIEQIWASYYSGDRNTAIDAMAAMTKRSDMPYGSAFAALALESGQGGRLPSWAYADGVENADERWQMIVAGLVKLLERGWKPTADTLPPALKGGPAIRRWEVARNLAARGHLRLACAIARSVPDELPKGMAAQGWMEYSQWQVALRDPAGTREALDRVLAEPPASASFADPVFGAMRARWLLTPSSERTKWEGQLSQRMEGWNSPGSKSAGTALLAALKGENEAARQAIENVPLDESGAESDDWAGRVQQSGRLLEQWHLARLARDLYRHYLSGDRTLRELQGQDFHEETETLLVTNKLLEGDKVSTSYLIDAWKAQGASQDDLLQAARRLAGSPNHNNVDAVVRQLSEEMPASDSVAGGVLAFTQNRRLVTPLRHYVQGMLTRPGSALSKAVANNAGLRLALLHQQEGDYADALSLLAMLDPSSPSASAAIQARALLLARLGRHREAVTVLEQPLLRGASANSLTLADLYASLGREREAATLLQRQLAPNSPNRVQAAARLEELAATSGAESASDNPQEAGSGSQEKNPGDQWSRKLSEMNQKFSDPEARYHAGSKFLLSDPRPPDAVREAEMAKLQRIAETHPSLEAASYLLRKNVAAQMNQTGRLETELLEEWAGGKGNYFAGEILLQLYIDQNRQGDLSRILAQYLNDSHYRPAAWRQLATNLLDARRDSLAELVLTELRKRTDGDADLDLKLAEALWRQGRPTAALVDPIEQVAAIDPARHLDLARYHLAVGNTDAGHSHLSQLPPLSVVDFQAGDAWANLLGQDLKRGRFAEAREVIIRMANRYPEQLQGSTVADYWEGVGELSRLAPAADPFELPGKVRRDWQAEMIERLASRKDTARAFEWIEKNPSLLESERVQNALRGLAQIDDERALKCWDMAAAQTGLWSIRTAAARAHHLRAQASDHKNDALKELEAAQKLDPGSFVIVQACVNAYLEAGRSKKAIETLEAALRSYSLPADRRSTKRMLESLKTSPALPPGRP